jgi:hypothetical protein
MALNGSQVGTGQEKFVDREEFERDLVREVEQRKKASLLRSVVGIPKIRKRSFGSGFLKATASPTL